MINPKTGRKMVPMMFKFFSVRLFPDYRRTLVSSNNDLNCMQQCIILMWHKIYKARCVLAGGDQQVGCKDAGHVQRRGVSEQCTGSDTCYIRHAAVAHPYMHNVKCASVRFG